MQNQQDDTPSRTLPANVTPEIEADLALVREVAEAHGIQVEINDDNIIFSRKSAVRTGRSALPTAFLGSLIEQIKRNPIPLTDRLGYSTSDAYFEVCIRGSHRELPIQFVLRKFSRYQQDPLGCVHSSEQLALPLTRLQEISPEADPPTSELRVHISDPNEKSCIELSLASPCAVLLGPYTNFPAGRFRPTLSLKIHGTKPMDRDDFVAYSNRITDSLLYELSVRNGIALEVIKPIDPGPRSLRDSQPSSSKIRFPRTAIEPNVAELFGFAESARDNLPLAYLSFYQVLEYFFPYAMRELKIRQIRRELTDPKFDESDAAIMRIVSAAETAAHASEGEQIATLLRASVREDRISDFLHSAEESKHFSKRGPISGVDPINVSDRSREPIDQIANRVYKLRNRIVHAKDDPKYESMKLLLPRSDEARALGPDIQLLRLLAEEVINDAQRRL